MISLAAVEFGSELSDQCYAAFFDLSSPNRQRQATRFFRREDACRGIIGEALARYGIALREKALPHSIVFTHNDYGKPIVDMPRNTQFNISHSKSWVVCAVDNGPVGIDLEHMHNTDMSIAKRFFHPDEYAEMIRLPDNLRRERFFDLWTLKESYVKALGRGLSCRLNGFAMILERDGITMRTEENLPVMNFKRYNFGPDYKCALCALHNDFPDKIELLTPEDLLEKLYPSLE